MYTFPEVVDADSGSVCELPGNDSTTSPGHGLHLLVQSAHHLAVQTAGQSLCAAAALPVAVVAGDQQEPHHLADLLGLAQVAAAVLRQDTSSGAADLVAPHPGAGLFLLYVAGLGHHGPGGLSGTCAYYAERDQEFSGPVPQALLNPTAA